MFMESSYKKINKDIGIIRTKAGIVGKKEWCIITPK